MKSGMNIHFKAKVNVPSCLSTKLQGGV